MGAGKGQARRARTATATRQGETIVDLLMRVEEEYCDQGRALRDEKIMRIVPDIDDLAELSDSEEVRNNIFENMIGITPVQQAELILMRQEYEELKREWDAHVASCALCRAASALQEKIMETV